MLSSSGILNKYNYRYYDVYNCTLYGVLTFGDFAKENGSQKQHDAFERHHLDYFKHVLDEHPFNDPLSVLQ